MHGGRSIYDGSIRQSARCELTAAIGFDLGDAVVRPLLGFDTAKGPQVINQLDRLNRDGFSRGRLSPSPTALEIDGDKP